MPRSESVKGESEYGSAVPTTVGIVNHDPTRCRAPGYSFGVRYNEKQRPTPGPQYKVEGSLTPRGSGYSPSYTITGRPKRSVFDTLITTGTPGPNAYNLHPDIHTSWARKAPMYSFGFPYKNSKGTAIPAPNSYNLPTTLGSRVPHLKGAPASTIHGKGSDIKGFSFDHARTPGPAGYGPVDLNYTTKRAPVITVKSRCKLPPIKVVTPGPGAYDTGNGNNVSKSSPRFSMGVRHGDNVRPMFTPADVSD